MKNNELAILFKRITTEDEIMLIPIKVIEGKFCKKHKCFIDCEGNRFYHIIAGLNNYGFCYHDSIINYKREYNNPSLALLKLKMIESIKKYVLLIM